MSFESVTVPTTDVYARAQARTLLQFRDSPVFQQLLSALVSQVAELVAAIEQTIKMRTAASAAGEQLDALGRIVGQGRELIDYAVIAWFTPDTAYVGADQGPAWVTGAPVAESFRADDFWLRQLIEGKAYRNFVKYGSVPEIQEMVRRSLGIDISIVRTTDPMTVILVVPDDTSINAMSLLERTKDTLVADGVTFLPIPATTKVAQVVRFSDYTP